MVEGTKESWYAEMQAQKENGIKQIWWWQKILGVWWWQKNPGSVGAV